MHAGQNNTGMTSSSSSAADRLRVAALACCNGKGDDASVTAFVDILIEPFKILNRGKEWELECEALLQQARSLLNPDVASRRELIDLVGVELPKVVVQYAGVSKECQESCDIIIQGLATAFDPAREMFTAILEAINIYSKPETLHLCLPLLSGLSLGRSVPQKIPQFEDLLRRRTAEFFKEAVPGLLELGRPSGQQHEEDPEDIRNDTSNPDRHLLSSDSLDSIQNKVIDGLIDLAKVIKKICDRAQETEKLRDTLGIFVLQLLAVTCRVLIDSTTRAVPDEVLELMRLLSFKSLSLSELICAANVDKIFNEVFDEEEIHAQKNRLEARRGAALAVYWGIQMDETGPMGGEIAGLKKKFQAPGMPVVLDVIGLASNLLAPVFGIQDLSFKHIGLSLMTAVLEQYCASSKTDDTSQVDDGLGITIQIVPDLQRLQDAIVYIPSPMLRRQAFGVLIKVISEVLPPRARFATLQSLISLSGGHPSLVSLLLTCVKDEVLKSWRKQKLEQDANKGNMSSSSPFISPDVLEFIQNGLRAKDGEIVELPTNVDAVVGALNLYLFLLILESSGNTNYTHVLSKEELVKGRTYWMLPLREQILRVRSALEAAGTDSYYEVQNGMDLLLNILYQCLEIVEQQLAKLPN